MLWGLFVSLLAAAGCVGFVPRTGETVSFGHPSSGVLLGGVPMPDAGIGHRRARPGESTRFGTGRLVKALERSTDAVVSAHPGTLPLKIGDLSGPIGGAHPRHRSHRTGRDADVLFYVTDSLGRPIESRGFVAFDTFGIAIDDHTGVREMVWFDDARNWHFVRALLIDDDTPVQWIFCSPGVKARLLRYAALFERDAEMIFRASWTLHTPSVGREHDDHFHIRIACNAEERSNGCIDQGPIWPWIRQAVEKPADRPGAPLDDEALIAALLSDES